MSLPSAAAPRNCHSYEQRHSPPVLSLNVLASMLNVSLRWSSSSVQTRLRLRKPNDLRSGVTVVDSALSNAALGGDFGIRSP